MKRPAGLVSLRRASQALFLALFILATGFLARDTFFSTDPHLALLAAHAVGARGARPGIAGCPIRFRRGEGDTRVAGDGLQLERVLENLLDNAVSFSPPHGEVEVRDIAGDVEVSNLNGAVELAGLSGGVAGGRRAESTNLFCHLADTGWPMKDGMTLVSRRGSSSANFRRSTP